MRPQSGKRKLRNGVLDKRDSHNELESFLALDRALVELFMHFYDVPGRERSVLRVQNQRLHRAVRRANVIRTGRAMPGHAEVRQKITREARVAG
jgi:hypothetical protein